ncbi:MAG: VOC family protein [Gemmatimonadaceae bacterium]|nr:VOC family protein [Gloeobacterales cyanobacterium ES-bin-141]
MQYRPHISLDVADLEAAVRFYCAVFGVAPTKRYLDYAHFRLESPALHLALVVNPDRDLRARGNEHFGIELFDRDALAKWQGQVEATGIVPRLEQSVTCCYAIADKFWLTDPDGHEWEFWVRSDEADSMHGQGQSTIRVPEPVVCCATVAAAAKISCCG